MGSSKKQGGYQTKLKNNALERILVEREHSFRDVEHYSGKIQKVFSFKPE